MKRLFDRYQTISFRGRLLLLLVAVSLIQAGVAAYTFFDLQAKPAEQRVQAQLNAALRGVAPVIDAELVNAGDLLQRLLDDPEMKQFVDSGNWAGVEQIIDSTSPIVRAGTTGADPSISVENPVAASEQPVIAIQAFVTDGEGKVVAGTKPGGALVEQAGITTSRLLLGPRLVATVHVPVVIDRAFLEKRIAQYVPKDVDVFVADRDHVMTTAGKAQDEQDRPADLREGLREVDFGSGEKQLALAQPLLDGSILVGASMPAAEASAQRKEGLSSLWGFIVLLGAIMIGVSWIITKAVADTLRKFADIARELANGQLDRRIPVTGGDEIAILSESFNDMAENLEDRIESLTLARASMRRQVELFGEALANATDIGEMLQAVCSLAMESTPATHSRFWTLDEEGHYEHAACIGLRPNDTEPCGLEKAVPVRNSSVRGEGSPHWLIIPARKRDGQIVGLLTLVSTADDFSAEDVRIAERVAVQAAVAIDNARMHERLRLQATRDGLTGLPNHRSVQDELTKRMAEAAASGMPLGLCMLDIDNFKRVNDTYGHPVGDEAIKAIGKTLAHGVGGMGMVGRFGGEEFVVIMPGCDADAAVRIADRLREDITFIEVPLDDGGVLKLTSSFGVANLDQQADGSIAVENAEFLRQADVGLYNAKRTGKNKVELAGPTTVVVEMSEAEKAKLAARERGDVAGEQEAASALETNIPEPAPYDPFDLAA